jgi:ParB-like chromosome segregation protein Spo0J
MSKIEKVAIKDLLPNPFRNMEHYRIPEVKVEALIRSFNTTGFWPNVIVRKTSDGKFEKAFGHARTAAGERLYGKNHKIDVVVMDLTDE